MEVVILAITKMSNGFCITGMTRDGRWVRPVPDDKLQWTSLFYKSGEQIEVGDILNIVGEPVIDPPHTEDIVVCQLIKIGKLSPSHLIQFLEEVSESVQALDETLSCNNRSLCLLTVSSFNTVYTESDSRKTRIAFTVGTRNYKNNTSKPGYPCVSLHWRAIQKYKLTFPRSLNKIFLAVGLSRGFTDKMGIWVNPAPMVISILTDPPLPGGIDYEDP